MSRLFHSTLLTALLLSFAAPAWAEDFDDESTVGTDLEESWYYKPTTPSPTPVSKPNSRAIVQQKAMARAEQRQFRMSALNWYGMSNSRPTAAATPFTSLYSPVWQTPGGRPFAWYSSGRPTFVFR